MNLGVVVLAAGQGTRMRSSVPKVLHELAGRPLLSHVVHTAAKLGATQVSVVYGHGGNQVPSALSDLNVTWVEQDKQLGTGHAVEVALPSLTETDKILVLYGDVPLIRAETLSRLIAASSESDLALLTAIVSDPQGYGRIVRDADQRVIRIVEQKDATPDEAAINEINTGILIADNRKLQTWVDQLDNRNAQGEFYLTDVIALAVADGVNVAVEHPQEIDEILGVNDRVQLAHLERSWQHRTASSLMRQGVTLADPSRIDIRGTLQVGRDSFIDVNAVFEGEVVIGDEVVVGPNCFIRNCTIGNGVRIAPNSVLEEASVGNDCRIGPFARLRPETRLADQVHVGNFVEIKKSSVATGSKINHLSYVGDTTVGSKVNIGAGTITCNYDGANKHHTVIGDNAFIGSDTQLVAPVTVGAGATIGAGSTITKDAPPDALTLSRAKQIQIKGWQRPTKSKT